MASLMDCEFLPPGFRFHPTDEDLFMFYLKRKVLGKSLHPEMISEVDVYRFVPWDLPSQSCLKLKDLNWYFFCPRSKKYANGRRPNRSTQHGYWKSTGNDRTVKYDNRPVGKIKTLVFYQGKLPRGDRTDWVMHEYRLEDKVLGDKGVAQDAFVICKVFKKSGVGPKIGEKYGAPFIEEEWESDDDKVETTVLHCRGFCVAGDQIALVTVNALSTASASIPTHEPMSCDAASPNASAITSALHIENVVAVAVSTPSTEQLTVVADTGFEATPLFVSETEDNEVGRMLAIVTKDDEAPSKLMKEMFDGLIDLPNDKLLFSLVGSGWPDDGLIELNDLN